MTRSRLPILAALLLSLSLALAPAVAEARAGSSMSRGSAGTSQGSMGSRTYAPTQAAPIQRSITPQATTPSVNRPAAGAPGYAGGGFGSGFFGGGFMSGLFGGLIGAGIGHMLFGGMGSGLGGMGGGIGAGGMLGSLLHLAFWGLIIYFGFRLFRRLFSGGSLFNTGSYRSSVEATPSGYGSAGYGAQPGSSASSVAYGGGGSPAAGGSDIAITDEDYNAFSGLLVAIQNGWSRGDLADLKRYMTPEMLSYFSEEMSRNTSDGVENKVEDVTFTNGSVVQAWREDDIDYATARISWTARDYYVRLDRKPGDRDYVVKGDPNQPVEVSEAWTFMRHRGGRWVLSAIQQV